MGTSSDAIGQIVGRRHRLIIEPTPHHPDDWGVRSCQTFGYLFQGTYEQCVRYLADNLPPLYYTGQTLEGILRLPGTLNLKNGEKLPVHIDEHLSQWFAGVSGTRVTLGRMSGGSYIIAKAERTGYKQPSVAIRYTNPEED